MAVAFTVKTRRTKIITSDILEFEGLTVLCILKKHLFGILKKGRYWDGDQSFYSQENEAVREPN